MPDYLDGTHKGVADVFRANRAAIAQAKADADAAAAQAAADAAAAEASSDAGAEKAKSVAFKAVSCDDLGVIIGIGAAAGSPSNLDLDGEYLEKGDLVAMAFDFCSAPNRTFKANHKDDIDVELVGSWVGTPIIKTDKGMRSLKAGEALSSDMSVVGIDVRDMSHWFVAVKPADPAVVEIAKAGGIAGFSWSGMVNKTEVD